MSQDPVRLFDDSSVPSEVRSALHHLQQKPPQSYDTSAGLARLQQAIGGPGGQPPPDGGAGAGGVVGGGAAKALALGAAGLAIAAIVAGVAVRSGAPGPVSLPPPGIQESTPAASVDLELGDLDEPIVAPESLPVLETTVSKGAVSATPKSQEQLYREELEHLASVRGAASSNPAVAARMADEGHRRFARGMLYQEREALAISCLQRAGRGGEAKSRAKRFVERFPKSPYSDQIRSAIGLGTP